MYMMEKTRYKRAYKSSSCKCTTTVRDTFVRWRHNTFVPNNQLQILRRDLTVVLFFFFLFSFFFVLELPDSFPVIIHFSLFSISYVISSNIKEGSVRRIHKGRYLKEEELHFSCFLSSLIVTFLLKFNERSLTIKGGGVGEKSGIILKARA